MKSSSTPACSRPSRTIRRAASSITTTAALSSAPRIVPPALRTRPSSITGSISPSGGTVSRCAQRKMGSRRRLGRATDRGCCPSSSRSPHLTRPRPTSARARRDRRSRRRQLPAPRRVGWGSRPAPRSAGRRRSAHGLDGHGSTTAGALEGCADEATEQRRRSRRAGLELRVELAGDEPGMVGELDDLDQEPFLERARDDEAACDELVAVVVVDLVAMAMALVDRRRAVELAGASALRARRRSAPSRIVPPRSSISFCSGRRSITGYGVSGSISVELAPSRPQTWRANSDTATCMPRQMPRYGIRCSRATRHARILPSEPRDPKPPGTRTPSTESSRPRLLEVMSSESNQRTLHLGA